MKRKMLFMVAALALAIAACSTDDSKTVVPKKPNITDHPQNFMCGQGDTVLLTVIATTRDKKAKLSYQWYSNTKKNAKGGTKVPSASGTLVSGEEGAQFEPPTDTIGVFYYYVEVTSALGKEKAKTSSEVAVITVMDRGDMPVISASNGDPSETEGGDDIVLTVTVYDDDDNSDPVVSYQWYSNTRNSNSGGTKIPDAVEASYQPPTDVQGTMYYYVVITTESGKSLSSLPMRVTVNEVTAKVGINAPAPFIISHPRSVSTPYYIGKTVTPLTVTATVKTIEGTPNNVTYQWYCNTENSNTGGELIEDADDSSYTPPNDVADTFYYYVVITNTIDDNGDGGRKVTETRSAVAIITVIPGRDAKTPAIVTQPVNVTFTKDQKATDLIVVAVSPDGLDGRLSYQWYKKDSESQEVGELLVGEIKSSYTPSTGTKGVTYFYVKVTNTIPDNGDGGKKTVSVYSNTVYVGVGVTVMTLNVPVNNKAYDGNTTATVAAINANSYSPSTTLSGATLHVGTATFAQAEVGTGIPVTLEGWYLTGANAGDYVMTVASNVTRNITKAAGAAVSAVPVAITPVPGHSITVNAVTLDAAATELQKAQQTAVEYACGTTNNITAANLTWQPGPTFTGLNCTTNYYIYARSAATANYNAGTYKVSAAIQTGQPSIVFVTNGGVNMAYTSVTKGQKFAQPGYGATTRAGYIFDYWYTDAALTTPYDFEAVINNNVTLYAGWVSEAVINEMRASKEMEWIKGGYFAMGSPGTETGRFEYNNYKYETQYPRVVLAGFWMGKYEVTQEKWQAVMGSNPSNFKTGLETGTPEKLPVENVSWYDALVFCNKLSIREGLSPAYRMNGSTNPNLWSNVPNGENALWEAVEIVAGSNGYRLPTEAQWEYACRAGTTTAYNTGAAINTDTGWYSANSASQTHKVGSKPANAWGLYDMHGNVAEWCQDYFAYSPATIPASSINPLNTVKGSQAYSFLTVAQDDRFSSSPSTLMTQLEWWNQLLGKWRYPPAPFLKQLDKRDINKGYVTGYDGNYYVYVYHTWRTAEDSPITNARVVRGGGYDYDARRLRSASRVTPQEHTTETYSYKSGNVTYTWDPGVTQWLEGLQTVVTNYDASAAARGEFPPLAGELPGTYLTNYTTYAGYEFPVSHAKSQGRYKNIGLRVVRP